MRADSTVRLMMIAVLAAILSACSDRSAEPAKAPTSAQITLPSASARFLRIETVEEASAGFGGALPARIAFRPQALSAVGAPVQGRITEVLVRPGEKVKAGMPLVAIQSTEVSAARASLDQARARAAAAEDLLRRQTEMVQKGVGVEVERFSAETAAREARAELERARQASNLLGGGGGDRTVLRATHAGVVMAVHARVGSVAAPGGDPLVEVGDPSQLWVVADLPEGETAAAVAGGRAEVMVPAAEGRFEAVVDGLGQTIDAEKRRLPVYLALRGAPGKLSPGMQAEVRLYRAAGAGMSLPTAAVLIKDGGRRVVYVQKGDGSFEARPVRTGAAREGRVTILDGLRPGDKAVTQGALLLDSEAEQLL